MQKAQARALTPRVWNTSGKLQLTLASRHDANFNYVTVSTRKMIKEGLIPLSFEQFYNRFDQGDVFLIQLNGQVNINVKINRESKLTMAFHCPRIVEIPKWDVDGSTTVEVDALVFGYTGLRLGKVPRHGCSRSHDEDGNCDQHPPLDARLDTPSEQAQTLPKFVNVDLGGISPNRKMDFILFVKNNMHLFNT